MLRQDTMHGDAAAINECGPIIGSFQGQSNRPHPIYAWITHRNAIFEYERIIYGDKEGGVALDQLADDEILIIPGIVYKLKKNDRGVIHAGN